MDANNRCGFRHDESAPATMTAMGYDTVLWGSEEFCPHVSAPTG